MKNLVTKTLGLALVLLLCAYVYIAYDHYLFNQNLEEFKEAQHRLAITAQKMENWKICVDGQPAEAQYMCDALIGYPQDMIRDFQMDRDIVSAAMKEIGEHSE